MKDLRKTIEVWETTKRKWTNTLFNYKQQKEALSNKVHALIKEKKDKENILIDPELINFKSVSLFNSEKIRTTTWAKIERLVEKNKEHQRNL